MARRQRHPAERPAPGSSGARCYVTLEPLAAAGYSAAGQRELAGGRGAFPSRLAMTRADIVQQRAATMQRMSISGVQDKLSLRLARGRLTPVERDGTHILKPVPATPFRLAGELPANEHITMMLAKHLGIRTAACGLIRLADDELAYITRRFDRKADGFRLFQEDFGSLAGRSADTDGKNWKYAFSYEGIGRLIAAHCSAKQRDLQEFFRRVAFCFLIGNGDAHIRNFSILRDEGGLVQLSPAYDLVNTAVHLPNDQELGLALLERDGAGSVSRSYEKLGFHSYPDFADLGRAIGLHDEEIGCILDQLSSPIAQERMDGLVMRSFLAAQGKEAYLAVLADRRAKFKQGRPA